LSRAIVSRADFQELVDTRLLEAKALLDLGLWDGSYYLSGYAVELALKAVIIDLLMKRDAFPSRDFSQKCYTHSIEGLFSVANLMDLLKVDMNADPELKANYATVNDWSETKRYARIEEREARDLFEAITNASHGVLPWVRAHS
jgi:HEPN domain-containing protein